MKEEVKGFRIKPYDSGSTLYLKIPTQVADYLKLTDKSTFWFTFHDDQLVYEIEKK